MAAINRLAQENFFFWDYGNAFLLEAQRAGESTRDIKGAGWGHTAEPSGFMGPPISDLASLGFGFSICFENRKSRWSAQGELSGKALPALRI